MLTPLQKEVAQVGRGLAIAVFTATMIVVATWPYLHSPVTLSQYAARVLAVTTHIPRDRYHSQMPGSRSALRRLATYPTSPPRPV